MGPHSGRARCARKVKLMIDITLLLKDIEYAGFRESGVHQEARPNNAGSVAVRDASESDFRLLGSDRGQ